MLNELYNYAINNSLAIKPGFKSKKVKAYISISKNGKLLGIEPETKMGVMCPDIGSTANGTTKCNVMAEKAEVVLLLDEKRKVKHEFFKEALKAASEYDNDLKACVYVLENSIDEARKILSENKIKASDIISFKVDDKSIIGRESYENWWNEFRATQSGVKNDNTNLERCMITGELCDGVDTVTKVPGLLSVGGHTSGDALICFDKAAFCSYGLQQAHNASVSEEAITTVNSALEQLLKEAPICAGAKVVHWYKDTISEEEDAFDYLMMGNKADVAEENTNGGDEQSINIGELRRLIKSIIDGKYPEKLVNRYYILILSGAGGRMMIRGYMQGKCEDLYKAFDAWYSDLSLESPNGTDKPIKLFAIYTRLLKKQSSDKKIVDRVSKELSGISPRIISAIINNSLLPDTMAVRALQYIRSDMMPGNDEKKAAIPDKTCCRILKAWVIRKYGKEKSGIMEKLNVENPNKAYHIGRMMAVFAAIQREALGDVGAGVIERYYSSAISTPALVIGRLSALSQYHLSKIAKKEYVVRYKKMLQEISNHIGVSIPTTLGLEEQSQFTLGYYQQCGKLFEKNDEE